MKKKKKSTKKKNARRTRIPEGKALTAVKYRIHPDGEAAHFFVLCFGHRRKYWNTALGDWEKQYEDWQKLPEGTWVNKPQSIQAARIPSGSYNSARFVPI